MRRTRLVLVALPIVTLAAELGLRLYAHLTHHERGIEFDAQLGWRMVPGAVKVGRYWGGAHPTRINAHGWRDADSTYEKPAGTRRVLVVGDSFTFGVGVDSEQRFSEVLETLVPASSGYRLEVLNLGMNAVGTDQELLYLEHDGLRYAPDVVVCALHEGNDFADVACTRNGYWPKPHFELVDGALVEVPPVVSWDVHLRACGYVGEGLYRLVQRFTIYRSEAPLWHGRDTTALVAALLLRMRASSAGVGARFLVLLIRGTSQEHPADGLLATLAREHIPVVDTGPRFDEPAERAERVLPNGHWSPAGHRIAAELLAAELRTLGWL